MYHNSIMEQLRKSGRLEAERKNITVTVCCGDPVLVYTDPELKLSGHLHCIDEKGINTVKDQLDVELFQRVYSLVS